MKQIRKRLTYANVMSSIAVFLILGGATAVAASKIGANRLKANSITTGKIKKNAVTAAKIKANSITTVKIAKDAVNGEKVNESTLGEVPKANTANSATTATTASNLVGQTSYALKLSAGQEQLIASHGTVSISAKCEGAVEGVDRVRLLASTTANGAVMQGDTSHLGDTGGFLETGTLENQRILTSSSTTPGTTHAEFDIDRGYVMGPEGKALGFNTEGGPLALNYAGAKCIANGIINALG
ncbi:MAG TPA: hypothetical protein VN756_00190 [Solirubrobacterales bacterium]|nr:hypothetical protein [Solirubrobacterales bacterium]